MQCKRVLETKWVFRVKEDVNSTLPRYKAKLVVKGFKQKKVLISMRFNVIHHNCAKFNYYF